MCYVDSMSDVLMLDILFLYIYSLDQEQKRLLTNAWADETAKGFQEINIEHHVYPGIYHRIQ